MMKIYLLAIIGSYLLMNGVYAAGPLDNPSELIGAEIKFRGNVVKKTCLIALGSDDQRVPLDTVDLKTLYKYGHGRKYPFEIALEECDLNIVHDVSVKFTGNGDLSLPGRLAVTGTEGIGIALFAKENSDERLNLGEWTEAQSLNAGSNVLKFHARVEGHPSAIAAQNIEAGEFQAITNFTLEYK